VPGTAETSLPGGISGEGAAGADGAPGPVIVAERATLEIDGTELLPPTSIALSAGECVAVRGPNGAGKTTLLRVLAGRQRPSGGTARLRGRPLDERRSGVRRDIAALIEPPTLYPDLTIRDQLELIEAVWDVSKSAGASESAPWVGAGSGALDLFDIAFLGERFPHELSSGQRQLVSLSVTFARPCAVLLLDEPEQRLDPDRRALVASAIERVRDAGAAVGFASHDADLVERVADRQIVVGPAGRS